MVKVGKWMVGILLEYVLLERIFILTVNTDSAVKVNILLIVNPIGT